MQQNNFMVYRSTWITQSPFNFQSKTKVLIILTGLSTLPEQTGIIVLYLRILGLIILMQLVLRHFMIIWSPYNTSNKLKPDRIFNIDEIGIKNIQWNSNISTTKDWNQIGKTTRGERRGTKTVCYYRNISWLLLCQYSEWMKVYL